MTRPTGKQTPEQFGRARARGRKPAAAADQREPRKFTVILDPDLAEALDVLLIDIRRRVGRPTGRAQVTRQLYRLLLDDQTLQRDVVDGIKADLQAGETA